MSTPQTVHTDEAISLTLRLLDELFSGDGAHRVGVRLWDGTYWPDAAPHPVTLVLKHPGALRSAFLPGTELGPVSKPEGRLVIARVTRNGQYTRCAVFESRLGRDGAEDAVQAISDQKKSPHLFPRCGD